MRVEPEFLAVFQQLLRLPRRAAITDICVSGLRSPRPTSSATEPLSTRWSSIRRRDGPRFCGIETKYTESFSVTEYDNPTYATVTRESGWFTNPEEALSALRHRRSNQLWRNVLLAAALERKGVRGTGWVAVVALANDRGAEAAAGAVAAALKEANRLKVVSLESIVEAAAQRPSLEAWSNEFRRRYLTPPAAVSEPEGDL